MQKDGESARGGQGLSAMATGSDEITAALGARFDGLVLVAEDDLVNSEVVGMMLEATGCRFHNAYSGTEAVEMATSTRYDMILMDCQMPEMDGFDATARIRELERAEGSGRERVTIVAMTGNNAQGDRELCLAKGMDDFLSKPFTFEELLALLERRFSKAPAPPAAEERAEPAAKGCTIDQRYLDNIISLQSDGGPDLLGRVIDHFFSDYPGVVGRLEESIEAGDGVAIRAVAHRFKSSSANLGALRLAEVCRELEAGGGGNSVGENRRILARMKDEFERAAEALTAIRQGR